MSYCGHERGASREECLYVICAGKRTQKYSKDDKERVITYELILDWQAVS